MGVGVYVGLGGDPRTERLTLTGYQRRWSHGRTGPTMVGKKRRSDESRGRTRRRPRRRRRRRRRTDRRTRVDTTDGRAFRPTFKRFSFAAATAAVFAQRHLRIFAQKMTPPPPPPPLLTPPHVTSAAGKGRGKTSENAREKNCM